jgi:hypothetical protein
VDPDQDLALIRLGIRDLLPVQDLRVSRLVDHHRVHRGLLSQLLDLKTG